MVIKIVVFVYNFIEKSKWNQTWPHPLVKIQIQIHKQVETTPTLHRSMFLKKKIQMEGKFLFVYIVKKLQKVGEFIKLKQHLVGVKQDIGPCKSIPPNVDFKWKILCRSLWNPRNIWIMVLWCHNLKGICQNVEKRFKICKILWQLVVEKEENQQWISILHQELLKELNLPLGVY